MNAAAEPGRAAYEARFAHARPRDVEPWHSLTPEARAVWARVERASQAQGHAGFSGCGVRMVCGSSSDIDLVQRWCHEASTIPALRARIREAEARAVTAEQRGAQAMRLICAEMVSGLRIIETPTRPEWEAENRGVDHAERTIRGAPKPRDYYGTGREAVRAALAGDTPKEQGGDSAA
ncbi:hypothetical protein SB2_07505 [Methylobacterium radiotolerans]|nr:hypothetical protein SB3_06315 [Methylobacterium radiotolerans]KTS48835.1 hypothetical protein SB2_07505 [Methylobacterium radiotolerans]